MSNVMKYTMKIKECIKVRKIDKKSIFIKSIFSFFFSFMLILDSKLIYTEKIDVFSDISFAPITINDFGKEILLFFFTYVGISLIQKIIKHVNLKKREENNNNNKVFFFFSFGILLLAWLPYFLSYFPGGIYSDTYASIIQLANIKENGFSLLSNINPILYTILLKVATMFGTHLFQNGFTGGILFFGIMQYIGCALAISYVIYIFSKKGLPKSIMIIILAFFSLFPLVPLYVISIWKDTPFNFVLIVYIAFLFDNIINSENIFQSKKEITFYCVLSFFVCFLRNNGFFIVFGTSIVLIIYQFKQHILNKFFLISTISLICSVVIIQGPIYTIFHIKGANFIESVAIPFQQISYSVKNGGEIEDKDREFLNQIMPIEFLNSTYKPLNFDVIKWNDQFNNLFFHTHKIEFIKLWFHLLPKNIKNYTQAYLLQTLGYWDVKKSSNVAYVQPYTWPMHTDLVEQQDVVNNLFHFSVRSLIDSFPIISSAIFIWIFFLSLTITCLNKKYKFLILYVPGLFVWIPIMIGVPIAFSLRYVYIFVLMLPFDFIIPLLPYTKKLKN